MELVDVVDSKSTAGDSVPVRVRSPAPARRKRHIACDELFHFIAKLIVRSFCCSSLPNHNRLRWVVIWLWVRTRELRRPGAASTLWIQMLGRSKFALRQGFGPLAQNACTAQMRRPAVRAPCSPGIYTVLILHVVAKLPLRPRFLCPILPPQKPPYSPPAGPKTPSKLGYGPPGDTLPRRRGAGLPQWEYTAVLAA